MGAFLMTPARRSKMMLLSRSPLPLAIVAAGMMYAVPAMAAQSSAYALSASLSAVGQPAVQIQPAVDTSGNTTLGQTYDNPMSQFWLSKSLALLPAVQQGPQLVALESRLDTDASGISGVDAVNTQGTSSAGMGIVALLGWPLSPATSALPLRIQFSKLKATANYGQVFPGPTHRTGATNVGSLTISGSLVGAKPLTFTGDIQPNTVVLDTPEVKITGNAQVIPQNPVCSPGIVCPLYRVLETVETQAVHVELNKAKVGGHEVSGEVIVGDAEAGQ
jgi:hypothetical protein